MEASYCVSTLIYSGLSCPAVCNISFAAVYIVFHTFQSTQIIAVFKSSFTYNTQIQLFVLKTLNTSAWCYQRQAAAVDLCELLMSC